MGGIYSLPKSYGGGVINAFDIISSETRKGRNQMGSESSGEIETEKMGV